MSKNSFLVVLFLVLMSVCSFAQTTIGFVSADQYRTVAGWRLHVVPEWGSLPFPPVDYEGANLMLSTLPMGNYPPYDAIAILQSSLVERDPEFKMLGKMETNQTWYGRLIFYCNGGNVYAQTSEFTFNLSEDLLYTGHSLWASSDFGWMSSFVFLNPTDEVSSLTISYYYQSGYPVPDHITTFSISPGAEKVFILNNVFPGFSGRVEFSSPDAPIEWWEYLSDGYGGSSQFSGILSIEQ